MSERILLQENEQQSDVATDDDASGEESADTDDLESYLSNHSSYADVSLADGQSLPSETVNQVSLTVAATKSYEYVINLCTVMYSGPTWLSFGLFFSVGGHCWCGDVTFTGR